MNPVVPNTSADTREWIIQRCINAFKNQYQDWPGYCERLLTREEMLVALNECDQLWPDYEFRGHKVSAAHRPDMESRSPTAHEIAGMLWWNSMTEVERTRALEDAGWKSGGTWTPSAADAWAHYKKNHGEKKQSRPPSANPEQKLSWVRGGNAAGISLQGYAPFPYRRIVEVFGTPERGEYGDQMAFDWTVTFADGTVACIYDFKVSAVYQIGLLSLQEIMHESFRDWHVGGKSPRALELVIRALS
jgi:hypothetical protein